MDTNAEKKMQEAIDLAKKVLSTASNQFDNGSRALEDKARQSSINLFGGTVTRQVAELVQQSRELCDELYATYQTQIQILDETCRPLLDDTTPVALLRDIQAVIKQMNEDSKITNNFTASLNQYDLGDLATVQYSPSMACKMIESYWTAKYEGHPDRQAFEDELRAANEKEKKERQQAASQRKKEEERAYKQALSEWEITAKEITQRREAALNQAGVSDAEARKQKLKKQLDSTIEAEAQRKQDWIGRRSDAQAELETLGFFAFGKKKEKKELIEWLTNQIASTDRIVESAKATYAENVKKINQEVRQARTKAEKELAKKYPLPRKPRKPLCLRYASPTPMQLVIFAEQNDVIYTLQKYGKLSFADLKAKCPAMIDLTFSRVSPMLESLEREGEIKITKRSGKSYYELAY